VISFSTELYPNGFTMKDDSDKREGKTGGPEQKNSRQDRLKLALRENLKRRKSQARGRSDATSDSDDASPHEGNEKEPG
jgi:hypothetical protein